MFPMVQKKDRFGRNEVLLFLLFLVIMVLYLSTEEVNWFNFLYHFLKNLIRSFF